jgi:hypothetical protein
MATRPPAPRIRIVEPKACALQDAVGRFELCPGETCSFWEPGGAVVEGGCVFERLHVDLRGPADVLAYLLIDLRASGEAAEAKPAQLKEKLFVERQRRPLATSPERRA